MPTVLRVGSIRFFFYSNEGHEPPHVHVVQAENVAKFWLEPIQIERSGGFNRSELGDLEANNRRASL